MSQQISKSSASSQSSQSSRASASSASSTTAAAKSSSSSDPNVVFDQTLTDTEWFVLAYSEKWQQSISQLASVPYFEVATSGDHPTINQGTGGSAALLTGSSTTDTSVSLNISSGPSYQATYHTITYTKADLKAKHLATAADVTALNNLVSQATARGNQDSDTATE